MLPFKYLSHPLTLCILQFLVFKLASQLIHLVLIAFTKIKYSMQYILEEAQLAEEVESKSESQTSNFGVNKFVLQDFFLFLSRGYNIACHLIAFTVLLALTGVLCIFYIL